MYGICTIASYVEQNSSRIAKIEREGHLPRVLGKLWALRWSIVHHKIGKSKKRTRRKRKTSPRQFNATIQAG
jgi:hypothetical protein